MRLLSCLRFGTARYPEKVARRLRLLNGAAWLSAAFGGCFAVAQFLDPTPGVWRPALVNLIGASALAAIPLLHRWGELAAPIALVATAYAYIFALIWLLGTDTGMQIQFLAIAAAAALLFGADHVRMSIAAAVVAAALAILLEIAVPGTTGLLPPSTVFVNFVAGVLGTTAILIAIVVHAIRVAARAEERADAERQRSDALLLNILPAGIAERLKEPGGGLIADRHDAASILFADMAGFTARAGDTDPDELVRFLNGVFTRFDDLVARHGLEKIKTTGDAYMVVAGVPEPRADHAPALARLALDMRELARGLKDPRGRDVPIRIGLASGPVVAGVVGSRKFFYDVWGDAVNVAARMEQTGEPGRIQVDEAARRLLEDSFELTPRGAIAIKGKGELQTWFLAGERTPAAGAGAAAVAAQAGPGPGTGLEWASGESRKPEGASR